MRKNEVERVGGRGKQRWWWAARMELQWSVEMKHKGEVTCFLFLDLQVSRLFLISHNFCLIIIFLIYIYMDIYIYIKSSLSLSTCIFFGIKIHIRSCRTLVTSSLDPIIKKHRLRGFYQVFNCGTWQGSFASVGCPTCLIDCLHVLYTKVQSSRC